MWYMSIKKNKTITEDSLGKFGTVTDIGVKQLLYVVRFQNLHVQYEAQADQDIFKVNRQWASTVLQHCSSPEANTMSHPNLMACSKNLTLRHVTAKTSQVRGGGTRRSDTRKEGQPRPDGT